MASVEDLKDPWIDIEADRLTGGARFVMELEKLGLFPDIAGWFWDLPTEEFRLAIVTAVVGEVGVRPLYKILVRAHAKALLPTEIDPLMIELFDPMTAFAVALRQRMPIVERSGPVRIRGKLHIDDPWVDHPLDPAGPNTQITFGDYRVSTRWFYRTNWERVSRLDPATEFKRFEAAVRKRAA